MISAPILILARAGSKRIPGKNLIDLCGKPLIQYSVEESLKVSEKVYVSSDWEELLKFVESLGAIPILRPAEFSKDISTSEEATRHWIDEITFSGNFILVQPTSPLVKSSHIQKGFDMLQEGFDIIISACSDVGYYYSKELNKIKKEIQFKINGAFFINNSFNIVSGIKFIPEQIQNNRVGFYLMPKIHSIDVDTYEDLEMVKLLMQS